MKKFVSVFFLEIHTKVPEAFTIYAKSIFMLQFIIKFRTDLKKEKYSIFLIAFVTPTSSN